MNAPSPSTITLLLLIPLFAWRVRRRFRRMVGRQRLSKVRLRPVLVEIIYWKRVSEILKESDDTAASKGMKGQ